MVPVRSSTVVKAIWVLDLVVICRFLTTVQTIVTVRLSYSLPSSPNSWAMVQVEYLAICSR